MLSLAGVLFDVGGTLDGPGLHWETRFAALYQREGLKVSDEQLAAAFGHSTRSAYADSAMRTRRLRETIEFHVARQMEFLHLKDDRAARRIVDSFVEDTEAAFAASRALLLRLRPRVKLGVISNFYGNCQLLLDDAGITPLLDVIVDSTCVGCSKPDPRIFRIALKGLGTEPTETLYVGDSFAKDIVPAHQLGLRTAWLVGPTARECPDPTAVDVTLHRLEDVESLIPKME